MSGQKSINCVNSESQFYHMKNRNNNLKKKKKQENKTTLYSELLFAGKSQDEMSIFWGTLRWCVDVFLSLFFIVISSARFLQEVKTFWKLEVKIQSGEWVPFQAAWGFTYLIK